jgi:hypothetical protein
MSVTLCSSSPLRIKVLAAVTEAPVISDANTLP